MASSLTQTVTFDAGVYRTYTAIADSHQHSAFTGAPASLATEAGGPFTTHEGQIEGRMLEIVPHERIVQAWRNAQWPSGVYSIVRYEFSGDSGRCEITLTHTGLPDGTDEQINAGWNNRYWAPLAEYLSSSK
jgi:activator of HSP90 ATPase